MIYILLILMTLTSCKKKLTQFYINYESFVTIPSTAGQLIPFSLYTPDITTNSEAKFEANDTRKDRIEQLKLENLTLVITSPQGETFSFLNSIELYLSSPKHSEIKVAFKESIPNSVAGYLECDIVDQDIQDYIKDDSFTIRVKTVTDETLPNDVEVKINSRYWVDAKLVK